MAEISCPAGSLTRSPAAPASLQFTGKIRCSTVDRGTVEDLRRPEGHCCDSNFMAWEPRVNCDRMTLCHTYDEYAYRIPNPNTPLSTPRVRYCIPKINNASAEQLRRAMLPLLLPYKKPCCRWPPRCHTLTTNWLPSELDKNKP